MSLLMTRSPPVSVSMGREPKVSTARCSSDSVQEDSPKRYADSTGTSETDINEKVSSELLMRNRICPSLFNNLL